jgi:ABC-type antimicrobial peptide transport system permease subunit
MRSLDDRRTQLLFTQYSIAITTVVLTTITFLLAAIGLYGILSYSTQMRRFEIGTRMAVGAKRWDLIRLIIKDNLSAILVGISIGLVLLIIGSHVFSEQLESHLSWPLLPVLLITLGLVSFISFVACYLPLRQYINKPAMYSLKVSD